MIIKRGESIKKEWSTPELRDLSVDLTRATEYVDYCNWNGPVTLENNEDYTNPNIKPSDHPNWVWCTVHNRWHPKNHGSDNSIVTGS